MSKGRTNTYIKNKINIRLSNLPDKNKLKVLDCYSGDCFLWNQIKQKTEKEIDILRIEKEKNKDGIYLRGDNIKFLKSLDLSYFDVIDLDAFGVPFKQLDIIFDKNYSGTVFITFIQSVFGGLNHKLLNSYGYTEAMIKKCPTLFYKRGFDIFKNYLAQKGITNIKYINKKNKYYLAVNTCFCEN